MPNAEKLKNETWVINKETGLIFIQNEYMVDNVMLKPYFPTVDEIRAGRKLNKVEVPVPIIEESALPIEETTLAVEEPVPTIVIESRNATIRNAIAKIPKKVWQDGRPRVADVEAVTGFSLTVDDIDTAMADILTK